MCTDDELRELTEERDRLKSRMRDIEEQYDGVPPLETWAKRFLDVLGGAIVPCDKEEHRSGLKEEIEALKARISELGG